MREVSVTPWRITEHGNKRPLEGMHYDSRSHVWDDALTLPKGADFWGVVPADLGCIVVDIDEGDPTNLLQALGYPPITSSVTGKTHAWVRYEGCLLYTSPSPRDRQKSRMPSSA